MCRVSTSGRTRTSTDLELNMPSSTTLLVTLYIMPTALYVTHHASVLPFCVNVRMSSSKQKSTTSTRPGTTINVTSMHESLKLPPPKQKHTNEVVACALATHVWLNVQPKWRNAVRVELCGHGNMTCSSMLGTIQKNEILTPKSNAMSFIDKAIHCGTLECRVSC